MNHSLRVLWPPDPDLRIIRKEGRWIIEGTLATDANSNTFKSKKKAKRHLKRLASSK
jgi:hypothetical protein